MKFKLWVEIQKLSYQDKNTDEHNEKWSISFCIHESTIYKKELFIQGYPISNYKEDNKIFEYQKFIFNGILRNKIKELLLPTAKSSSLLVKRGTAWDYYHYTLYVKDFIYNIHPISMGNGFIRQEFEGTQEEIYEKCLLLNKNWISKDKNLNNNL